MLDSFYAYLAGLLCTLVYFLYARKNKVSKRRIMLTCVFILYMTAVFSLTLFPLVYDRAYSTPSDAIENRLHLIPFSVISGMIQHGLPQYAILQIGGNLIMTIPFGFAVIPLFRYRIKKHRKLFFICLAFAFPLFIELTQLLIGVVFGTYYRTCDIDDVILNSSGIFIGYGMFLIAERLYRKFSDKKTNTNIR